MQAYNKLTEEDFINNVKTKNPKILSILTITGKYTTSKEKITCMTKYGEISVWPFNMYTMKTFRISNATNPTEFFINKANEKHDNKYNYKKVEYVRKDVAVTVTCPLHGDFNIPAAEHLSGNGCTLCGRERTIKAHKKTHEEFMLEVYENHPGYMDGIEIVTPYTGIKNYMVVKNKYGELKFKPKKLLLGTPFTIANAIDPTSYIVNMFTEKNTRGYEYDLVEYKALDQYVSIRCPIHSIFTRRVDRHLEGQGCPTCDNIHWGSEVNSHQEFLSKLAQRNPIAFKELTFIGKYAGFYAEIEVKGVDGIQTVKPSNLYQGKSYRGYRNGGYSRGDYHIIANGRPTYCYIAKLTHGTESLYKIGITIDFKKRFKRQGMPYKAEKIFMVQGSAGFVYDLESHLQNKHREFSILPKLKFKGYTECFSEILPHAELDNIINKFKLNYKELYSGND